MQTASCLPDRSRIWPTNGNHHADAPWAERPESALRACCYGVATVLLRYCEPVGPLYIRCTSLVQPLYNRCTSLLGLLGLGTISLGRSDQSAGATFSSSS